MTISEAHDAPGHCTVDQADDLKPLPPVLAHRVGHTQQPWLAHLECHFFPYLTAQRGDRHLAKLNLALGELPVSLVRATPLAASDHEHSAVVVAEERRHHKQSAIRLPRHGCAG